MLGLGLGFIVLTVSINNLLQFLSRVFKGPPVNT